MSQTGSIHFASIKPSSKIDGSALKLLLIYDATNNSITGLDTEELNHQFLTELGISNTNTIVTSSAALETETIFANWKRRHGLDIVDWSWKSKNRPTHETGRVQ
ncbi:10237_t:CDS:2 [Paraglomus occultum]|uniref:10237_t:CDS:1 n=1 Tax=Paraglomus occultum TaxID=144539 RepID=A0A9N9F3J9_9GLOM|nr:10237_t:CDS:2 [Paraglomus occultum]